MDEAYRHTCLGCKWAKKHTPYRVLLPLGHVRCDHPMTHEKRPLISAEKGNRAVRDDLEIHGPWEDQANFRWPWSFRPELLRYCVENRRKP